MTVPFLCAVAFFFLAWVLVLKAESADQRKEIERLKTLLRKKLGQLDQEVSVSGKLRMNSEGHDRAPQVKIGR